MNRKASYPKALFCALAISLPAAAWGGGPAMYPRPQLDDLGLAVRGGPGVHRLRFEGGPATGEKDLAWSLLRSTGQGGGGDVTGMNTFQTTYGGGVGDVVIVWRETSENLEGVNVFQDGTLLGNVPGLPADQLPGTNGVTIGDVPVGVHTYRIEGGGTSAEKSQEVVAAQPFSDPTALSCTTGDFRDPENGTCQMDVTWSIEGTAPTRYALLINGTQIANLDGADRDVTVNNVPPGNHCAALVGILQTPQGNYQGGRVETCCDIACEDTACDPLGNLLICQIEYGPVNTDNLLRVEWDNGELPYVGVTGYIDGAAAGTLSGDTEVAFVQNLAAGSHTIGVEGNCGAGGKTPILEEMFDVLTATPHTNPIAGSLTCTFDPAVPSTLVTWTNDQASAFVDVYVTRAPSEPAWIGRIGGASTGVEVTGTRETDVVGLQFFHFEGDFCYGSRAIACGEGVLYIQGVCDGVGTTPAIGSAVFGLQHLFQSGPAPPCMKACDADGDGNVVITDMVLVLNFLFQGGPAPSLWVDTNGDSIADPVCTQAGPADDCATGNPGCPLPP
jgi:hypothetical protein